MLEATFKRILEEALAKVTEFSVATGDATDGSTTTLEDTNAVWEVNKWADAIVEITDATDDKHYYVTITSNTADTLTFPAIAATVAADDHYEIRMTLRLADIDKWGGTSLTGRDISLDFKSLTDDSIKGLLKSIGDIAALENLITRIGQTSDDSVAAGATGSVAAKLRRVTQGLEDLKTTIILAAGSAVIGKVRLVTTAGHEITDDTLDAIKAVTQTAAQAGQAPVGINVTVASTQILAVNTSRKSAIICNDSDTTMWLAIGQTAVANQGIRLNANGGVLVISINGEIFSTEAVNGIHAGVGNKVASAQELN